MKKEIKKFKKELTKLIKKEIITISTYSYKENPDLVMNDFEKEFNNQFYFIIIDGYKNLNKFLKTTELLKISNRKMVVGRLFLKNIILDDTINLNPFNTIHIDKTLTLENCNINQINLYHHQIDLELVKSNIKIVNMAVERLYINNECDVFPDFVNNYIQSVILKSNNKHNRKLLKLKTSEIILDNIRNDVNPLKVENVFNFDMDSWQELKKQGYIKLFT